MERRLAHDLGSVRIHTDAHADLLAGRLRARALTVGGDILFRRGSYEPDTVRGRTLLAHELVHTMQQERMADAPRIQRQGEDEPETGSFEDEADEGPADENAEEADPESDEGADESSEAEDEKEAEEQKKEAKADGKAAKQGKPRAVRRRRIHRTSVFSGRRTKIFGGKRGKYFKNWVWSWGKVKTERGPSLTSVRDQTLNASDTPDPVTAGDSEITAHGAAFYQGEKIAGEPVELPNFMRTIAIFVVAPKPALQAREKSTTISTTKTAKGSLRYRFGDESDPKSGPRARIVVERLDSETGEWTPVHDTKLITTTGRWRTDILNGKLTPDSVYQVRIFAEYWKLVPGQEYSWADGRTQVDYVVTMSEQVTKKVTITKTVPGKSIVTKDARKFRLRL